MVGHGGLLLAGAAYGVDGGRRHQPQLGGACGHDGGIRGADHGHAQHRRFVGQRIDSRVAFVAAHVADVNCLDAIGYAWSNWLYNSGSRWPLSPMSTNDRSGRYPAPAHGLELDLVAQRAGDRAQPVVAQKIGPAGMPLISMNSTRKSYKFHGLLDT